MLATVIALVLHMCILISGSSMLWVLMALGMFMFVKVISYLISVMSPTTCLCSLSVHMVSFVVGCSHVVC